MKITYKLEDIAAQAQPIVALQLPTINIGFGYGLNFNVQPVAPVNNEPNKAGAAQPAKDPENTGPTVFAIITGYLMDPQGALKLAPATLRQEATRLGYVIQWREDFPARDFNDPKLDEFYIWRYRLGNLARGRKGQPIDENSMDLIGFTIGNAMKWAVNKKVLDKVPFERRCALKAGRLPLERSKKAKIQRRAEVRDEDEKADHDGEWKKPMTLAQINRLVDYIVTPKYDVSKPRNYADIARALGIAPQMVGYYAKKFPDFPEKNAAGIFDIEEVKAFLGRHGFNPGHWDGKTGRIDNEKVNRWLASEYIEILAFGGGRRYATRMILKTDVDLPGRKLTWPMRTQKRGHGKPPKQDYILDINDDLARVLKELLAFKPRHPWLFPSPRDHIPDNPLEKLRKCRPASCSFFTKYLEEALEHTGIEEEVGESISFHDFRHFFIVQMVSNPDLPYRLIADWCCHSTTEMIEEVYGTRIRTGLAGQLARAVRFH